MTAKTHTANAELATFKRDNIPATLDKLVGAKHPARIADAIVVHRDPLSAQFGTMPDPQFLDLVESIAEHGYRDPVVSVRVTDDAVYAVEGWHRISAGAQTTRGKDLTVTKADDDAARDVMQANLFRRHLTPSMRAAFVVEARKGGESMRKLADRIGVSYKTVKRLAGAIKKTDPAKRAETVKAVKAGEKTVGDVAESAGTVEPSRTREGRATGATRTATQPPRTPQPKRDGPNLQPTPPTPKRDPEDACRDAHTAALQAIGTMRDAGGALYLERLAVALFETLHKVDPKRAQRVALANAETLQAARDADKPQPTKAFPAGKKPGVRECILAGLEARKAEPVKTRSAKYASFKLGTQLIHVGKNGAVRVGKTPSASSANDALRESLAADGRTVLQAS